MSRMSDAKKRILKVGPNNRMEALIEAGKKRDLSPVLQQLEKAGNQRIEKSDLWTQQGPLGQLFFKIKKCGSSGIMVVDQIMAHLQDHGEHIQTQDWLQTKSGKSNLLDWAVQKGVVGKIFQPQLWDNRLDDMEDLWHHVSENGRKQVPDYEALRRRVRFSTVRFDIRPGLKKSDLFKPNDEGYVPLEDTRIWRRWNEIIPALAGGQNQGLLVNAFSEFDLEKTITKADLMAQSPSGKTFIEIAIEAGVLSKIAKHLEERGEPLTRQDYEELGLEDVIKDIDQKLYNAAEKGEINTVSTLAFTGVANLDANHGSSGYTPSIAAGQKGHSKVVVTLLEAGSDPDARSEKTKSLSLLWVCSKNTDEKAVDATVEALKEKYESDPVALLGALTVINNSMTPQQAAEDAQKPGSANIIRKAADEAVQAVAALDTKGLLATQNGRKCGLDLLIANNRLSAVFTVSKWRGNPRGLGELAGQVSREELVKQLSGEDGIPTYAQILSQVNAGTIKGMSQRTFEMV